MFISDNKHSISMNKSSRKAQVAIEYIILVAFLLFIISIATAYAMFTYYENVKISSVRNTVFTMEKAANQVYALGPGNVIFADIVLPAGVSNDSLAINKEFFYRVQLFSGNSDFVADVKGNITDFQLPYSAGVHTIKVEVVDENIVFTEV